LKFWRSKRVHH